MKMRKIGGASLAAMASCIASTVAVAQDDTAYDGAGIQDIVVTAQKRAENVQSVPIAISAVTGEYLESRNITSIDQLGTIAPNVKIERAASNKTISQIAMRGSVTINPAITFEPAVGLYVDGVYIAKSQGGIFDVADLERVEVLRGPQGTLYGRNTLAGAINLITKKPSGELGGSVELTYGSYNDRRLRAVLDLPRFGIFSAKISGQVRKRDGVIKVDQTDPAALAFGAYPRSVRRTNDIDGHSLLAQLRAQPTDTLTFDYSFDYARNNQRPDYPQLYYVNPAIIPLIAPYASKERQSRASLNANPLFEKQKIQGHSLTASLEIGAATLKSITAYRKVAFDDSLDLDGSPFPIAHTQQFTKYESFSQELQLAGATLDDRLNYVVGAFYFKDKASTVNPQSFFFGSTRFRSNYGSRTEAYALYAQLDYEVIDGLTLTGGLRYNNERKDISRLLQSLPAAADPNAPPISTPTTPATTLIDVRRGDIPKAKYNNFSPAFTLRYEFTPEVSAYARFAKGYKSGGFNGETNVFSFTPPPGGCPFGADELCNPYKPEKVDSYELGLKTRLLNNTLQLNIAGFWDEHKDIQLSVFDGQGAAASTVVNAAASRIRGIEVEAVARPSRALTVNASFAYLEAKYKRFIDAGADVSDNRAFPATPKFTIGVGADWTVAEGEWGKFNLTGDLNFVSKYYSFPFALRGNRANEQLAGDSQSPGRTIVNLTGRLSELNLGGLDASISLWVKNLTKENNPSNFIDFGPSFGNLTVAYFPDPRTFGVTLGAKF